MRLRRQAPGGEFPSAVARIAAAARSTAMYEPPCFFFAFIYLFILFVHSIFPFDLFIRFIFRFIIHLLFYFIFLFYFFVGL